MRKLMPLDVIDLIVNIDRQGEDESWMELLCAILTRSYPTPEGQSN